MKEPANILLVDDQPARLMTYEAILEELGHVLVKAGSGREALQRLMETEFAAILLDVSMPEMDGFETAALIRDHPRYEATPIIFVTAVHMTDMDQLRGYQIGAVDYVYVPVVPEILRGKVQVLAEVFSHRRELQRLNQRLETANADLTKAHARLRDENTRELRMLNVTLEAANEELEFSNAALRREVTEREQAQRTLQLDAERKDQFLATLAHELRNPLSAIHNAVQVIRGHPKSDAQLGTMSDVLGRQVRHLTRLVEDLVDVARISSGRINLRRAPLNLAEVVRDAIEMSQPAINARQQTLNWRPPETPVMVDGDPVRLAQVVDNLLRNASQYTGEGGQIEIALTQAVSTSGAAMATLRVRDNGIGIPESMLVHVFEMFSQVSPQIPNSQAGLGIGLSLVRALVELHGGRVRAHSKGPGEGSEFVVSVPCLESREIGGAGASPAAQAAPLALAPKWLKVLVVDDNVDSADAVALWLRREGHAVEVAHAGAAGLQVALAWQPDVVLLDIRMPGMDGHEVARRLRRESALERLTLVAMTGFGAPTDRLRAEESGFDHYIVKPIDFGLLHSILGSIDADAAGGALDDDQGSLRRRADALNMHRPS
jgi:signal transduction histidine kinase